MNTSTAIALVGLGASIVVYIISIGKFVGQIAALEKLINWRLDRLETKQDKYNHLQERVAVLERDNKTAFNLIDRLGGHSEIRG